MVTMSDATNNSHLTAALDLAADVVERVKDGAMISFAQNYEDVLLRRAFPEPTVGFFVDVGAFHPIKNSVTQHFHLRGWSGVNIDPDERNIETFNELRPNDTNLCVAVGEYNGNTRIYSLPNTSRTTALADLAASYRERGLEIHEREVPTRCLASLLDDYAPKTIDFLKIDVEGAEYDVIVGGDWQRHRPKIVLAEATYPETDRPNWQQWEFILLEAGYIFAYYDGLNRYYVRNEDSSLVDCFDRPPNYFDDFVRADIVDLAKAITSSNPSRDKNMKGPIA